MQSPPKAFASPTRVTQAVNPEVKRIVQKMEQKGGNVLDLVNMIETDKTGKITIAAFTRAMGRWFP
jgi:hypothetical protein